MPESFAGITVPKGEPEGLNAAGAGFDSLAGGLSQVAARLESAPERLASWQGLASTLFAGFGMSSGAAAHAGVEAFALAAQAARRYADQLEQAQEQARRAIDEARDAQARLDEAQGRLGGALAAEAAANGRAAIAAAEVVATSVVGAPSPGAQAAQMQAEAEAAAAAEEAALAQRAIDQARDDLERAKERGRRAEEAARDAATAAAGAFAGLGGSTPHVGMPGAPAGAFAGGPGAFVAYGGAFVALSGDRLVSGGRSLDTGTATPAQVAAFFRAIGPGEGERLASVRPDLVGSLNGAPAELRYQSNRELAVREVARLEGELEAVNAELAEEQDGGGWPVVPPLGPPIVPLGRQVADIFVKTREEQLEEQRDQLEDRIELMEGFTDPDRQLLVFDPSGDGRIAEVFGDLDDSGNVSVFVPGIGNDIVNFSGENRAEVLRVHDEASRLAAGDQATVAWLDYESPDGFSDPATYSNDNAAEGAGNLSDLMRGIEAQSPGAHTSVFGHSYGSVVVGQSAAHHGLMADDVVLTGSPGPGTGVDHASDLQGGDPTRRIWVGETPFDLIAEPPAMDGSIAANIHGPDPADPEFGARRFDTGEPLEPIPPLVEVEHVDVPLPDIDTGHVEVPVPGPPGLPPLGSVEIPVPVPGIEDRSVPYPEPHPENIDDIARELKARHTTAYFDPRTESFRNIARIASGRGDEVTLVAP